ncbi:hypothetical protein TNCV_310351 [Trichonephila clavipes]|nr:hypothetical protein TNCV_310351 [Trichonephila clavipes]
MSYGRSLPPKNLGVQGRIQVDSHKDLDSVCEGLTYFRGFSYLFLFSPALSRGTSHRGVYVGKGGIGE